MGRKTHGMYNTRLYDIWVNMKQRCFNPNDQAYHNYGGRGIAVCDEWKENFQEFYDWAIANGYGDTLSVDRIDNNGNYCPENCRWTDRNVQNRNRRNNHKLTYNGVSKTVVEWAEEKNMPYELLLNRLNKLGWSVERSLTTPIEKRMHNCSLSYNGKTMNISEWAKETGISTNVIGTRLKRGWSVEDALTKPLRKYK